MRPRCGVRHCKATSQFDCDYCGMRVCTDHRSSDESIHPKTTLCTVCEISYRALGGPKLLRCIQCNYFTLDGALCGYCKSSQA
jgi:hypothetical protein